MSALLVFAGTAVLVRFNAVPRFAQGARWLAAPFEIAQQISKGWRLMLSHKKTLSGLIALVIINTALMIAITYLIMSSIHISLSLPRVVLYSVLGSLSVFINITPGNLGIKEAVYIAVSGIVGLSTSQILAAALVDRVVLFVVLLLLWLIYARKLYRIDTTLKPTE
jgi:uncharacterized protein (TIRG00374 family)